MPPSIAPRPRGLCLDEWPFRTSSNSLLDIPLASVFGLGGESFVRVCIGAYKHVVGDYAVLIHLAKTFSFYP